MTCYQTRSSIVLTSHLTPHTGTPTQLHSTPLHSTFPHHRHMVWRTRNKTLRLLFTSPHYQRWTPNGTSSNLEGSTNKTQEYLDFYFSLQPHGIEGPFRPRFLSRLSMHRPSPYLFTADRFGQSTTLCSCQPFDLTALSTDSIHLTLTVSIFLAWIVGGFAGSCILTFSASSPVEAPG